MDALGMGNSNFSLLKYGKGHVHFCHFENLFTLLDSQQVLSAVVEQFGYRLLKNSEAGSNAEEISIAKKLGFELEEIKRECDALQGISDNQQIIIQILRKKGNKDDV